VSKTTEASVEDQLREEIAKRDEALGRKDTALSQARKGLFAILNVDPVTFVQGPGSPPAIVRAFQRVQELADRTVLNISDAESPFNG
jgi:hypothetical protein